MALSQSLLSGASEAPALDVLVVGGGPVGVLAATELANRGCKVRIIDLHEKPVILTKASGVSERSMEILPQHVTDSILQTSKHVKKARMHEHDGSGNAKVVANIGMETDMRGGKGIRSQMQWLTEKALTEYFETFPDTSKPGQKMHVDRPLELVSFKEVGNGVECEIQNVNTGATERVLAKFLLGCDGGRSTVRKSLGFTFDGETTAEYFFALHAQLTNYIGDDTSVDMCFSKGDDPLAPGWGFAMPMPDGGYLIIVDLDLNQQREWQTGEVDRNGLPVLRQPSVDDVCQILRMRGFGKDLAVVPDSVKWNAHFRVNSRMTNHYGKGRVYLAGDACHCHSPLGGQGMNMGFNDAKNIAWKLAWAAKGVVPMSLLDSYEKERQPIETKILHGIEKGQKVMSSRNPVFFFMRGRGQRIAPVLLNFALEHTDGQLLRYGTQQAWSYATSPLAVEHWERPSCLPIPCPAVWHRKNQNLFRWMGTRIRAGDTVPDAPVGDTTIQKTLKRSKGWTLILFEGSADDNAILARYASNVKIYGRDDLQSMGEALKTSADATGFVSGIDEVIVDPADGAAQTAFGVRAQCLFLIRPDFHVALRSEPLRTDAVLKYFDQNCGMKVAKYSVPPSSGTFDPLPLTVYGILFMSTLSYCLVNGFGTKWISGFCAFFAFVLCFLLKVSGPPRD